MANPEADLKQRSVQEAGRSFLLRTVTAVGGLVSTLLTSVVAVRTLEPREAAALLAILAGLMLGPMFGKLGLGQNVIRLVAAECDEDRRRQTIGSHLRAAALLAVVSSPILALAATAALAGEPNARLAWALTMVLLIAETLRLMLSDVFAATGDVVASVATMHHVRSIVVLPALIAVAVLSSRPTLIQMLVAYTGMATALLLVAMFRARRSVSAVGRWQHGTLLATVAGGLVLFVLDVSAFVVGRGDVWLASAMFHPVDAERYGTVSMLAFQVTVLQGLASLALTPVAARMWAAGQHTSVLRMLSAAATLVTAVTAVAVAGLAVVGRVFLQTAYGPEFASSFGLLLVLAMGGLGQAAFGFNVTLLLVSGRIRQSAIAALMVLAVAVPAAVAAAAWGGPVALSYASGLAAVGLSASQWIVARRAYAGAPFPRWNVLSALRNVWRAVQLQKTTGAD